MAAGAAATGRSASLSKRCPQTPCGSRGGSADRSPATPGQARRGLHTKRRGTPSLRQCQGREPPTRLAADGPRLPPSPRPSGANGRAREGPSLGLTHSSVPQLMVELENSHRLADPPVCPSVRWPRRRSVCPSLAGRQARGFGALPTKVPPTPGSPVSGKDATGGAAADAASPPPGAGREGARGEGSGRGAPWDRGGSGSPGVRRLGPCGRVSVRRPLPARRSGLPQFCRRHSDLCLQEGEGEKERRPSPRSAPRPLGRGNSSFPPFLPLGST